ncbi:UDP-N-acetylmuramoyl-L-alanine--D-glutamate ligase [Rhodocyclus tenuis]|uniref:UDP-N-acetylmuramoyl-L-alanine--D-glutamate ligase n=1 Tax=Rhodocyclus gracilis TaxID=2929842 RepID=UPI001298946A|nr:UDP-N-acetylmuramoyl-L-alanine--D-glutamate ligase [Rhodocyclus gracilis]MRD73871.1 UDP-N-acetylmuramoyl-L-alanine--D-glutamate ligase [Rhodocyclus gracilis]
MNTSGERTLILGLGESGLASAKWLARSGTPLRIADSRTQPPNLDAIARWAPAAEVVCGAFTDAILDGIDRIVLSPGVPLATPEVQRAIAAGIPVVSEIQLFVDAIRELDASARLLAITGSNGKTTTTALTAALATAAGFPAIACGNISPSALDALMDAEDAGALPDVWVLELSSFQLETTYTLGADAATLLNVSEDHLDRYTGMDDYAAAKRRVFQPARGRGGVRVLNRDDPRSLVSADVADPDVRVVTFGLDAPTREGDYGLLGNVIVRGEEALVEVDRLRLVGRHNAANAMAALALCEAIGIGPRHVVPALREFSGLPHRVVPVAEIGGVLYIDDSKGTNVGATLAAITGLGRPLAIILGGDGKGQDFAPLAAALAGQDGVRTRAIALIGRDAASIAAALDVAGSTAARAVCIDMDEAVRFCAAHTRSGDAVLLSPACASLDMYRNYAHRADSFVAAVGGLNEEAP